MDNSDLYNYTYSALSGNGKLKINYIINELRHELIEDFGYDSDMLYNIAIDITHYIVDKKLMDRYDDTKGSKQMYINGITKLWLSNHVKTLRKRREVWLSERDKEILSQYDFDIDTWINETIISEYDRPDEYVEAKEMIQFIQENLKGVDILILRDEISIKKAAESFGNDYTTFFRNHKKRVKKVEKILQDLQS